MTAQPPAGWYPDPSGAAPLRWWDGQTWTASTSDGAPVPAASVPAASVAEPVGVTAGQTVASTPGVVAQPHLQGQYAPYGAYPQQQPWAAQAGYATGQVSASGWQRNRYAFITFGIVAAYVLVALSSRIVFFGILPLGMSVRSRRGREPLAPFAIGAAVVSIVFAFAALSHH